MSVSSEVRFESSTPLYQFNSFLVFSGSGNTSSITNSSTNLLAKIGSTNSFATKLFNTCTIERAYIFDPDFAMSRFNKLSTNFLELKSLAMPAGPAKIPKLIPAFVGVAPPFKNRRVLIAPN